MNQFCPTTPNTCDPSSTSGTGVNAGDSANPVSNFSSEAPDVPIFIGHNYPLDPPPLGSIWYANTCAGRITSTISQQDANDRAAQAAITCLPYVTPQPNPDPNPDPNEPPVIFVPTITYQNTAQTCITTCPDGSTFGYVVAAGTVTAFSLAAANAQAMSLACNRNLLARICIGALAVDRSCLDAAFSQTVTFTFQNPLNVLIINGGLPTGLILTNTTSSFTISGTPTETGTFAFTVQVLGPGGNHAEKSFTLSIATIANTSLAAGTVGAAYSQTLTTTGPILGLAHWTVVSGSLPAGLSLNENTGAITGTPTVAGSSTFTVQMEDGF